MGKGLNISFVALGWILIGVLVAINQSYGHQLDNSTQWATFVTAVLMWPFVVMGATVLVQF
jgi:hypothetical protein